MPLPAPPAEPPAPADSAAGIRPTGDASWPVIADGGKFVARFGNAPGRLAELTLPEGKVVLQARTKLRIGEPVIDGAGVVFRDVASDTDLRFDVGPDGITQRVVLRSARARHDVSVYVADPDGALTGLKDTGDGSYHLGSAEQAGLTVMPAYAYEHKAGARGHIKDPKSAHQSVTAENGGFVVRSWVDRAWAADRRYPLVLDPDYVVTTTGAPAGGRFIPVDVARALFTANAIGVPTTTPVPANGSVTFQVTDDNGIPANGVSAVMADINASNPTASGYLLAYPAGATKPLASTVNFIANQQVSNSAIVKVGTGGQITVFNGSSVAVHVIMDVSGYFTSTATDDQAGGVLKLVDPTVRIHDTRWTGAGGALVGPVSRDFDIAGLGGLPTDTSQMSSVVLNVTAAAPSAKTYLTVYPKGTTRPQISSVDAAASVSTGHLLVAKLGADGDVSVYNSTGTSHVLIDVVGYYTPPLENGFSPFTPVVMKRVVDTRNGIGSPTSQVASGATRDFQISGQGDVPTSDAAIVAIDVQTLNVSAGGYLSVWNPDDTEPTGVSMVMAAVGQARHNLLFVPLSSAGKIRVRSVNMATDVIVDVSGWFRTPRYAPAVTWRIAEPAPVPGFAAGSTVTVEMTVTNPDPLKAITLDATVPVPPTTAVAANGGWIGSTACALPVCGRSGTFGELYKFTGVPVAAGATVVLKAPLTVKAARGCAISVIAASQSKMLATYSEGWQYKHIPADDLYFTVCEGGLGMESWWAYDQQPTGPGGRIAVNVANGNAVVQQEDSTPIQGHGDLGLVVRRTYNSQDLGVTTLPGELGRGWVLNVGEVSAAPFGGVVANGMKIPTGETVVTPGPVTLVDRDGTRHTFNPGAFAAAVRVLGTSPITFQPPAVGLTAPVALTLPAGKTDICVDQGYAAPSGVHLSLWRYVAVNVTSGTACTSANIASGQIVGWAAVRPDRLRTEYDALGRLVSMKDGAGNELRYTHGVGGGFTVTEQRMDATARRTMSLSAPVPFLGGTACGETAGTSMTLTDAAGRVTTYCRVVAGAHSYLTRVLNPDGTAIDYRYGDVPRADGGSSPSCATNGDDGLLCQVIDARGRATSLTYTAAVTGAAMALGSMQVETIVDRRGMETRFDYHYADAGNPTQFVNVDRVDKDSSGAERSRHRTRFSAIDYAGRVAQVDEGAPTSDLSGIVALRSTVYTWDEPVPCRTDGAARSDNLLCKVRRKALNPATTPAQGYEHSPDEVVSFTYNSEGLVVRRTTNTAPDVAGNVWLETSTGYRAQYVKTTEVTCWDDVLGPGTVTITLATCTGHGAPTSGGHFISNTTLYVVSDLRETLTPRGNVADAATWTQYRTRYVADNDATDSPNVAVATDPNDDAPVCASGQATANSGLVCAVEAPFDGATTATTSYEYDVLGQRKYETLPTGGTYKYDYYTGTQRDLSGTTPAAGWLRGIVDPAQKFVAFGYDAAGNPVRTWDRNATAKAGTALSAYPGTEASPPSGEYVQDLWEALPTKTSLSGPWRVPVSHRDQLGNTSTRVLDDNGNPTTITPAGRGATTNTFDYSDNLLTRTDPKPAGVAGTTVTTFTYDDYGQLVTEQDANGNKTSHVYDAVHRPVATYTLREDTTFAAPGCTTSTAAMIGMPANARVCAPGGTVTYDGVDRPVSYTTGSGFSGHRTYDGVGRLVTSADPRQEMAFTQRRYDRDGNVVKECLPESVRRVGWTECDAAGGNVYGVDMTYTTADRLATSAVKRRASTGGTATTYTTSFAYDKNGNQITVSVPVSGRPATTTVYDAQNRVVCKQSPRGTGSAWNHVVTGYDPSGNVTSRSRPIDGTCPTESEILPTSRTTQWTFDAAHRLTKVVDSPTTNGAGTDGGTDVRTEYRYDAGNRVTAILDPRAFTTGAADPETTPFVTRMEYDVAGRLSKRSVPRSGGTLAPEPSLTLPDGTPVDDQSTDCPATAGINTCTTEYVYDVAGRLVTQWLPTSGSTRTKATSGRGARYVDFAYYPDGLVSQVKAPAPAGNGDRAVTRRYYDGAGAVVVEGGPRFDPTAPLSSALQMTSTSYFGDGQVAIRTHPDGIPQSSPSSAGHVESFSYNTNGKPTGYTDPGGRVTTQTYYTDGRLESVRAPSSRYGKPTPTTYGYDTADVTSYEYDGVGNVLKVFSPSANAAGTAFADATFTTNTPTVNTYTHDNMLAVALTPIGNDGVEHRRDTYGYDAAGRKTTVTTETGTVSGSTFTGAGNASSAAFAYYDNDRLSTRTSRTGATVTTTYDAAGNPVSMSASDNAAANVTAAYYYDGLVRSVTSQGRTTTYAYDGAGREVAHDLTRAADGVATPGTTVTRYDDSGLPAQVWAPAAAEASGTGDLGAGRFARTYDIAGRPLTETAPNGAFNQLTWRNDDVLTTSEVRPTAASTDVLSRWDFGYDRAYRVTSRTFSGTEAGGTPVSGTAAAFTYTPGGRLESFTYGTAATKYANWDHNGNRTCYGEDCDRGTTVDSSGPSKSKYVYRADNAIKSETSAAGTTAYSYEAFGGVSGDRCSTYAYDGFDRLSSVTTRSGVSGCTAPGSSYEYDALDRQVTRTSGGTSTELHYVGLGSVSDRSVKAGAAVDVALDARGFPLAVEDATKTQYLVDNGQGSIGTVVSSSATVACQTGYDAFGAPLSAASAAGTWSCTSSVTPNDRWFNAGRRDEATGNYQLGGRTYDPSKATFLTPDAAGPAGPGPEVAIGDDPLTSNRYSYVNGDPVNFADPTGHVRGDDSGPLSDNALRHMCSVVERKYASSDAQANRIERGCLLSYGFEVDFKTNLGAFVRAGIGFIPVVGDLVDLYDCVGGLFSDDRNMVDIALSCGAAIPVAGNIANVAKGARAIDNVSDIGKTAKALDTVDDIHDAGHGADIARTTSKVTKPSDAVDVTRRAQKASDAADDVHDAGKVAGTPPGKAWRRGDPIDAKTAAGNDPAWSTVRGRYWKNRAADANGEFSPENIERMSRGRAPIDERYNTGASMELSHTVARYQGGGNSIDNLEELWPWEHAAIDPHRYYTGPTPPGWPS